MRIFPPPLHDLLRPGALTLLESLPPSYPRPAHDLLLHIVISALHEGGEVLLVDGGNSFDVHEVVQIAKKRGESLEDVLTGIRVARGFTAYQVQTLIEEILPAESSSRTRLLAVLSISDFLLDEEIVPREGRALLRRSLGALRNLAGDLGVPAVITSPLPPHPRRRALRALLRSRLDDVVLVGRKGRDLVLFLPHAEVPLKEDALGVQRTLSDYGG